MTKVRNVDALQDIDDDYAIWWEYYEEHENYYENLHYQEGLSWQWYMERDIRTKEGWTVVIVSEQHKYQTVVNWLKAQGAVFKHDQDHFLIQDPKIATLATLKFS